MMTVEQLNAEYRKAKSSSITRYKLLHRLDEDIEVVGTVVKGKQLQKLFGYPTVNIEHSKSIQTGLYLGQCKYGSMIVKVNEHNLEGHIIGWDGDLYGECLQIRLFSLFDRTGIKQFVNTLES